MNHLNVLAKALYDNVAKSPDELSFCKGDIMTVLDRTCRAWTASGSAHCTGTRASCPYTPMLPATYQPLPDSVYLVPTLSKTQQGLYQAPGPSPQFQSSPAKQTSTFLKQTPHHPACPVQPPSSLQSSSIGEQGRAQRPASVRRPTRCPAFTKAKPFDPTRTSLVLAAPTPDSPPAEDVYDVLPPAPDLYDVPPGLWRPGPGTCTTCPVNGCFLLKWPTVARLTMHAQQPVGVLLGGGGARRRTPGVGSRCGGPGSAAAGCERHRCPPPGPGRQRRWDPKLAQHPSHRSHWCRSCGPPWLQSRVQSTSCRSSAVGNAAHTSDCALHAKLSRQWQKMEDVHQTLVAHGPAHDAGRGGPGTTPEDLDQLVACSWAVPEDAKELASFLHGNASLLFRRTKAPALGPEGGGALHPNLTNKVSSIQSRPLPSPTKFTSQDSPDGQDENSEGG
ncbi:hypothetical protein P7K49_031849 [Saguinus oedipus]|uniref:SH3 domain-containing protein n=1 Tax=Saguinus oedipus TaxID=9490 RepID=A0ABQ9U2H4_SAGOE|nr:hypothetical protein P7K49_031849 [Saguinus oedipus]